MDSTLICFTKFQTDDICPCPSVNEDLISCITKLGRKNAHAILRLRAHVSLLATTAQQIFRDLSDTFSVRKMQLLGGQWPPQDLLGGQRPPQGTCPSLRLAKRSWSGQRLPKSCIFLTENVSDKSRKICCMLVQIDGCLS